MSNKSQKYWLGMVVLQFILIPCYGQDQDFGAWTGVSIDKKLTKKFTASLDLQMRSESNASKLNNYFPDLSLKYKVSKYLDLSYNYRFIMKPLKPVSHRFYVNANVNMSKLYNKTFKPKTKLKRMEISYRFRFQKEITVLKRDADAIRNKLQFKYNLRKSKLNPYISGELFYRMKDYVVYTEDEIQFVNRLSKYRVKYGIDWHLGKRTSLDVFYLYQKQIDGPKSESVIAARISFKPKGKLFKKKGAGSE